MCLPSLPRPAMRRPTSAALSVLNCRHTPDSGQYVFSLNEAFGTFAAGVASLSLLSAVLFRFFSLLYFGSSRFGNLYFVVTRAFRSC